MNNLNQAVGSQIEHKGSTWTVANYFTHNGIRYVRLDNSKHRTETGCRYFAINVRVN